MQKHSLLGAVSKRVQANPARSVLAWRQRFSLKSLSLAGLACLMAFSLVLSTGISLFFPSNQATAATFKDMTLEEKTLSAVYFDALQNCIKNVHLIGEGLGNGNQMSTEHAASGDWFADSPPMHTGLITSNDGSCNTILKEATALWGYGDNFYSKTGESFLCNILDRTNPNIDQGTNKGFARIGGKKASWHKDDNTSNCRDGTTNFRDFKDDEKGNTVAAAFAGEIRSRLSVSSEDFSKIAGFLAFSDDNKRDMEYTEGKAALYLLYYAAFFNGCEPKEISAVPSANASQLTVETVAKDGRVVTNTYEVLSADTKKAQVYPLWEATSVPGGSGTAPTYTSAHSATCQEITDKLTGRLPDDDVERFGGVLGYADAYAMYIKKNPKEKDDIPDKESEIPDTTTSCAIDFIGWLICPVMSFLGSLADGAYYFLSNNFLEVDASLFNRSAENDPVYTVWIQVRNVANILFIIIFLIVIFSQLTSIGISNYGIKRMLPRLVIAVVLVNLSYFISQAVVDISNILGHSIYSVFESWQNTVAGIAEGTAYPVGTEGTWVGIVATVIGGGVLIFLLLAALIPTLVAAVVSLLMMFFILVARQALVVLLVIISPLAFVAFILPNTESWFKKWGKTLVAMLLLFPIVAAVFGGSRLASKVITTTFNNKVEGDGNNIFGQIIGGLVQVLPLFLVPSLIKKSLDAVGNVSGLLSKFRSGVRGTVGKGFQEAYGRNSWERGRATRREAKRQYKTGKFAENINKFGAKGRRSLRGRLAGGVAITKAGKYGQTRLYATAEAEADEMDAKQLAAAKIPISKAVFKDKPLENTEEKLALIRGERITKNDKGEIIREKVNSITDQSGRVFDRNDEYTRRAMIENVIATGGYEQVAGLIDVVGGVPNNSNAKERKSLNAAFAANPSKRPGFYDGLQVGNMDVGQVMNHNKLVNTAITKHIYPPEKLKSADKDEVKDLHAEAVRIKTNAEAAFQNKTIDLDTYNAEINKVSVFVNDVNNLLNNPDYTHLRAGMDKNLENTEAILKDPALSDLIGLISGQSGPTSGNTGSAPNS